MIPIPFRFRAWRLPLSGLLAAMFAHFGSGAATAASPDAATVGHYSGAFVEGRGDVRTLEAIDAAFEATRPSPRMVCLPLFYKRDWNGFVEAPYWPCWWTQNPFGATYGLMPFLGEEPYASWIANAQDMWFRKMGDGKRADSSGDVAPDGCLMDAAYFHLSGGNSNGFGDFRGLGPPRAHAQIAPINGEVVDSGCWFKQGDANRVVTDWYFGGTAAGLIVEADRLLARHDVAAARARLPELKRVAAFIDSRRDPETNLIKGGHNSNLLAPSFRGARKADGTYELGYLTELSVNYVVGLERLAEVCLLCGEAEAAGHYRMTASKVRHGLPRLMTPEGYFIKSLESDGRHGVFGAPQHGYFEAHPNHDAGAFRVTDDAANKRIVDFMLRKVRGAEAPGNLFPRHFVLPNYPGYDDHSGEGDMTYGTWCNGGVWPAHEGMMGIACFRAGEYAHPLDAWGAMRLLFEAFRADAPLANWGATPWGGPLSRPWCFCFDNLGPAAGLLRGLFEYEYTARGLRLWPHIPETVGRYAQKLPASFGQTRIYLAVTGTGPITRARVNGKAKPVGSDGSLFLPLDGSPVTATVEFLRGGAKPEGVLTRQIAATIPAASQVAFWTAQPASATAPTGQLADLSAAGAFLQLMQKAGLKDSFEAGQARTVVGLLAALQERRALAAAGKLRVPDLKASHNIPPADPLEVDELYRDTARWILGGLQDHLRGVSLQKYPVRPDVLRIAKAAGLLEAGN